MTPTPPRPPHQRSRRLASLVGTTLLSVMLVLGPVATAAPRWEWPTGGPGDVVREFDPPQVAWASGHRGVDLALDVGSPVVAAGPGVVIYAADLAGRGVVSIEHDDGRRTTYEPVIATVARGDVVEAGQEIGTLQAGHCPDGCLHFGLRDGEDYLDPLSLFEPVRIRLLPLRTR